MYNVKRSLITLLGLSTLIAIAAAITPLKGYSQQNPKAVTATQDVRIVNATNTPVPTKIVNAANAPVQTRDVDGPRANNIVTLHADSQTSYDFRRVFSNGTSPAVEFVVPENRVLIVTDVVWEANGIGTGIRLAVRGAGGAIHLVHVSQLISSNNFSVSSTESLKTGFAAAAGARIEITISGSPPSEVILHGYLVPAS